MHYYKFNISDWQSSTRHLSPDEEGVYFRLINYYYDTEKPIPLETQPVIRRLMLGSHADTVATILEEFFVKTDKGYEKEKCNELIKEYKKTAKKNKANGAKGGRPSKIKGSSITEEKPTGLPLATEKEPKHNPNQEPRTINQEPETISRAKAKRFTPPTTTMVFEYMKERGVNDEFLSERFVDYYASKGWMIGKNKMKDWKAAVRTWLTKRKQEEPPQRPQMKESTPVKKPYISPEKRAENIARFQEEKRKMGLL